MVALGGCVFGGEGFGNDQFKAAGEACRADKECSSGGCYGGICEAGSCNGNDSDCPTNYKCLYDDGDPLFGIAPATTARWRAAPVVRSAGNAAARDQTCYFLGPEVTVTANVAMPTAGEPVTFTAAISRTSRPR